MKKAELQDRVDYLEGALLRVNQQSTKALNLGDADLAKEKSRAYAKGRISGLKSRTNQGAPDRQIYDWRREIIVLKQQLEDAQDRASKNFANARQFSDALREIKRLVRLNWTNRDTRKAICEIIDELP